MDIQIDDLFWQKYLDNISQSYPKQDTTSDGQSKPIQVVIYIRVSSEEQKEGYSLEQQERECRAYADSQGWVVVGVYVDDGYSGTNANRPAFKKLMRDSKKQKFEGVLTHKIDRTYRHMEGMISTFNFWRKRGIFFASVMERIDFTTPWGKLILVILSMLAEIFVDNLREEVKKGKRGRVLAQLHNGPIPFGYCNGKCSNCTDNNGPGYCYRVGLPDRHHGKHAVPHPIDSQAVPYAYALYLQGTYTDRQVADALNQFQVRTPDDRLVQVRSRGKPGLEPQPFTKDMVRDLLQNPFYAGGIPYYGSEYNGEQVIKNYKPQAIKNGKHLALITKQQLKQARTIRTTKGKAPQGQGKKGRAMARVYVLQSLLDCFRCASPMHCQAGGGNARRHVCWTRIQRTGACDQPSVKADNLETELTQQMACFNLPAAWQEEIIGYLLDEEGLEMIMAQRQALHEHFNYIKRLYRRQEITRQVYLKELRAYERSIADLSLEERTDIDLDYVRSLLSDFPKLWALLTDLERKSIAQALIHGASVDNQRILEWRWYAPFVSLFQPPH